MQSFQNIDAYIASFPASTQKMLTAMRTTIQKAAPEAVEAMKYGIPTFVLGKNLVHFAGYKNHIGFYPAPSGIEAFRKELAGYETSKGAIQFPIDQQLPLKLVSQITQFRVAETKAKLKTAGVKKVCPNGHSYTKTSDCPTCPKCEAEKKPSAGFLSTLAAPARRALEGAGIKTLKQLASKREDDLLAMHGFGPAALPKLRKALDDAGLKFKD